MVRRAYTQERWVENKRRLCRKWGLSEEDADALLDALPYSTIPGWIDVDIVLTEVKRILDDSHVRDDSHPERR